MKEFKPGQLVVILSPFTEAEVYGNIKFVSDKSITLSIKNTGILKEGWDILCLIIDETDALEFYSKVESLEGNTIKIERHVEANLCTIEKRRFNRVDCEIGFVGRPMMINNVSIAKSGKTFMGTIKNISAGGVMVETNLCFPTDMVFSFKLKINYFIDCTAKVRRVSEVPNQNKYEMGCEFINMSVEDMKAIAMFAFKEQLKRKRKELYDSIFK